MDEHATTDGAKTAARFFNRFLSQVLPSKSSYIIAILSLPQNDAHFNVTKDLVRRYVSELYWRQPKVVVLKPEGNAISAIFPRNTRKSDQRENQSRETPPPVPDNADDKAL
jgi:hypothetical protein